jgi:hypothetical protein
MNQIKISVLKALAGVCLLSSPCWALGEADGLWNAGVVGGKETAEIAAKWRPQGIKALPVLTNPLDLSRLGHKLDELNKNIEDAIGWSKMPFPSVGIDFGDGLVVKGLLPNADDAGVQLGDVVLEVNGHKVFTRKDVADNSPGDNLELTLASGAKIKFEKQPFPTVPPAFFSWIKDLTSKYQKTLDDLKARAANSGGNLQAQQSLAYEASELNLVIDQTAEALKDEQRSVFENAFRR